jgi:5-formyltetrahydrofolate cyclo-ligase
LDEIANGRCGPAIPSIFDTSVDRGSTTVQGAELEADRKRLRREALVRRAEARAKTGPLAGDLLSSQFAEHVPLQPSAVVSGYWPIRDEITPVPLMKWLHDTNVQVVLPAVVEEEGLLRFRRWQPDMELEPGPFGTSHPPSDIGEARPTIVCVPLLAFDDNGNRLGYGAGYYDRTLAALRGGESPLHVGLAYEAQRVESVPTHIGDERLHWVVTENAARRIS